MGDVCNQSKEKRKDWALVKYNFFKAGSVWQKAKEGKQCNVVRIRESLEAHWSIGLFVGGLGRGVGASALFSKAKDRRHDDSLHQGTCRAFTLVCGPSLMPISFPSLSPYSK